MSDEQRKNLLTDAARSEPAEYTKSYGITFSLEADGWVRARGTAKEDIGERCACSGKASDPVRLVAGTYTLSAEVEDASASYMQAGGVRTLVQTYGAPTETIAILWHNKASSVTFIVDEAHAGLPLQLWGPIIRKGTTVDLRVRFMLVEGDTPAAWAPADGEEIAGGASL